MRERVYFCTAEEMRTCSECGGTIPVGHKYWFHQWSQRSEHRNCMDYDVGGNENKRRRVAGAAGARAQN